MSGDQERGQSAFRGPPQRPRLPGEAGPGRGTVLFGQRWRLGMAMWNVCGDSMGMSAGSVLSCHLPSSPGPSPVGPETLQHLAVCLGLAIPVPQGPPHRAGQPKLDTQGTESGRNLIGPRKKRHLTNQNLSAETISHAPGRGPPRPACGQDKQSESEAPSLSLSEPVGDRSYHLNV